MKHINFHDLCVIGDALSLYTKTMKELEEAKPTTSERAMADLHDNIERSILLKKLFGDITGELMLDKTDDLSVNIVAKFYND